MILHCTLILPDDLDVDGFQVEVRVEDVTREDDRAEVVGSLRLAADAVSRRGRRLGPVSLHVSLPDPGARYTVRGLVTRGPSLAPGDLLSTCSIPVGEDGAEDSVDVPLTRVT